MLTATPPPQIRTTHELFSRLSTCWICGGTGLRPNHTLLFDFRNYGDQDRLLSRYTDERIKLSRCSNCGFAQPEALPTLSDYFDRMYDQRWAEGWMQNEFDCGYKDFIFESILDRLEISIAKADRSLLDIGAHVGRFIFLAHQRSWQVEGIELNPQTRAYAIRRTGLTVHHLNAHGLQESGKRYQAVTMIDVLEHIPDPLHILRQAHALLNDNGRIVIKVPSGPAQYFKEHLRQKLDRSYRPTLADNLVHVNHFSPKSLRIALEKVGFQDVTVRAAAPELPPGDAVGQKFARFIRRLVFRLVRCIPGGVNTPLALHLEAVGIKSPSTR